MPASKASEDTSVAPGFSRCTVSRKGAGKISTGERHSHEIDVTYDAGAVVDLPCHVADALEERAYVTVA